MYPRQMRVENPQETLEMKQMLAVYREMLTTARECLSCR